MNIDDRIKALPRPDERNATYEIRAELLDIKQLIRDVLEEVKPEPKIVSDGDFKRYQFQAAGYNQAVDEMEAKIKGLGL